MAESLNQWGEADVHWHICFDREFRYVGGQALKNRMLDEINDGWVWVMDDDTVAHPQLWGAFESATEQNGVSAVVVSQKHAAFGILHAAPENVIVGGIDIGQAIVRRDVIGDDRIPETYAGDGEFLCSVLPRAQTVYLKRVLSFHNALEGR